MEERNVIEKVKNTPKDKDTFGEGIEMFAKKITFFNQTAICRQPSLKQKRKIRPKMRRRGALQTNILKILGKLLNQPSSNKRDNNIVLYSSTL